MIQIDRVVRLKWGYINIYYKGSLIWCKFEYASFECD